MDSHIADMHDHASPAVGEVCLVSTTEHRYFRNPLAVYATNAIEEVEGLLETIDRRVQSETLYAVGYLAYEAASAFDDALRTHVVGSEPLLWFGLYEDYDTVLPESSLQDVAPPVWMPSVSKSEFDVSIGRIRDYIAAGDTYQVNYTFPMNAKFAGDAYSWFRQISEAQSAAYCAFINTGECTVISASPELFFKLDGTQLTTKPMKGTIARGLTPESDVAQRKCLISSPKDRAENIMIVDLLRNDMGRISTMGSVQVESTFDVEQFDSLWQMTSTISSETHAAIPEIFRALFPSGSVTGTPKIRASEIIHELESSPRGAYCGAIGWWGPDHQAEFNVSIRTAVFDGEEETIRYSVGAGITWDSSADAEYAECLLKAEVVSHLQPSFQLLESLLWDGEYFLLDRHLARLQQSADYFGFAVDEADVRTAVELAVSGTLSEPTKVRLLLSRNGEFTIETEPIVRTDTYRVMLAHEAIDLNNVFLYHKTSHRNVYEKATEGVDADDVILWNVRGEITESTRANVVMKRNGTWITPPISSGLLAGTYRAQLIDDGTIEEGVITKEELLTAEEIGLINSVRRWIQIELVSVEIMSNA